MVCRKLTVPDSEVKVLPTVSAKHTHTHKSSKSVRLQHILPQHTNDLYLVHKGIQKLKMFDVLPEISDKKADA